MDYTCKNNEKRMTFLEVINSTLPSSSMNYPSQPPWLSTEEYNPNLSPPSASLLPPLLGPIQVGTISASLVTMRDNKKITICFETTN